MSGKSRPFRMTPEQEDFVAGAKVQANNTEQHNAVQHSTEQLPWEDLSAGSKTINFKFTPELYAMASWCKANVPGGVSYLEILRRGCEQVCRELIERHKPRE